MTPPHPWFVCWLASPFPTDFSGQLGHISTCHLCVGLFLSCLLCSTGQFVHLSVNAMLFNDHSCRKRLDYLVGQVFLSFFLHLLSWLFLSFFFPTHILEQASQVAHTHTNTTCLDFNWHYVDYMDQFGENRHLHDSESSSSWKRGSFLFFRSSLMSFS